MCLCFEAWRKFHIFFLGCRGNWSVTQKVTSNGGSYAFQPFNSPLQMLVTVKANMPILTLDSIFPNGEGLKNVEKLMLKRKSIIEEVFIFQDTQEEDVAPFTPKMKQPRKEPNIKEDGEGQRRQRALR